MGESIDKNTENTIRRILGADSRIDAAEIEVAVVDGTVYLSGSVDGAAERLAILEVVKLTTGVRDVIDSLELRNFIERTNDELKESVRNAIARDISIDAHLVSVEANDGEVTLRGHVDSSAQKFSVEDIVWWTPGVTDVVNCLEIVDESGVPIDLKE
ncbi:MAG: BON domain-containing protein [Armatimonadota bacterium]|jgi:osmotically-inducible protein OsmY